MKILVNLCDKCGERDNERVRKGKRMRDVHSSVERERERMRGQNRMKE